MRPCKKRRKLVEELAENCVYENNGTVYDDKFNPFVPDTISYRQFKHAYESKCKIYHFCESMMTEMREVYGF